MTERRRLVREETEARSPRLERHATGARSPGELRARRLDNGRGDDLDDDVEGWSGGPRGAHARRRRWTGGRPSLGQDFGDLGRGTFFVGIESAAIALDTLARVLRASVDRAFDEDYDRPGDLVRGVANEADLAAYDLANELRTVPRRLARRFDESLRSPRADRGERDRRENGGLEERRPPRPKRRDDR
jgi:hypothetical protein